MCLLQEAQLIFPGLSNAFGRNFDVWFLFNTRLTFMKQKVLKFWTANQNFADNTIDDEAFLNISMETIEYISDFDIKFTRN